MIRTASVALSAALLLFTGCRDNDRIESIEHMNKGSEALHAQSVETAIVELTEAVRLYPKNHMAEYQLGNAYDKRNAPVESATHYGKAVQELPDNVVYNMFYGIALYKQAVFQAKDAEAKKQGKKIEQITDSDVDLRAINFDESAKYLEQAIKLDPSLWGSHYYLGRIYRIHDKPQLAAQEFTAAIQGDPREQAPYVALAELYRRWDYTDQAIQVAAQGQANVLGQARAEVNYVLGMAYFDKKKLDDAVDAFGKAIEDSGRQNHRALFQRGLALFVLGKTKDAKKDLEEYSKTAGESEQFNKSMANKVLMDIAAKQI
jgi:tetratricopeptide (TPR) repeat protein